MNQENCINYAAKLTTNCTGYMHRVRINSLLAQAIKKRLVIVCAGMGYGKTLAVSDFTSRIADTVTLWRQLSSFDNTPPRFWENYLRALEQVKKSTGEAYALGFPDTDDKLKRYYDLRDRMMAALPYSRYLVIFDDFHLINNSAVIKFIERSIYDAPDSCSFILICRELSQINISSLFLRDMVAVINESDLNFTESELTQYLLFENVTVKAREIPIIYQDTKGWAFVVNFIGRLLKNSAGYSGYVQNVMKQNIYQLLEMEVWGVASKRLKHFLLRLSLLDNLSADLVLTLARGDESLLDDLRRQSAYVRFDNYLNAYMIHHLFIDFLRTKTGILAADESRDTYKAAADWCKQNNYLVDAIHYYEKIGEYESIVLIYIEFLHLELPHDLALFALEIFERAPAETFERVDFFAVIHVYTLMALGRLDEFFALAGYYEKNFVSLPEDNALRNHALAGIYYCFGYARSLMSTVNDCYDFDLYFAKMSECLAKAPIYLPQVLIIGSWVNTAGSSRQGAPLEYLEALTKSIKSASPFVKGAVSLSDLCHGEFLFYQGNIQAAERFLVMALESARRHKHYAIVSKSLFYIERIAVFQGDLKKAEKALEELAALRNEKEYASRYFNYDITEGWFLYMVREPDKVAGWLKETFVQYEHAIFPVSFGNQMRARYFYMTKNYAVLLTFMEDQRHQVSILYGRAELLAMEACARYKMQDYKSARDVLREAYETASPNDIMMPFIELGRDMRALATAVIRDQDCGIPQQWLKTVKNRSAYYAKSQALVITDYEKENGTNSEIVLSKREKEVLRDLYNGLSSPEIAAKQRLSVNTVKMITKNIFKKLNVNSLVDAIRISVEQKLL